MFPLALDDVCYSIRFWALTQITRLKQCSIPTPLWTIRTNTLVNDPYQHPCERSVPTPLWTIRTNTLVNDPYQHPCERSVPTPLWTIRTNTLVNDPYQHPCERSVPTPLWTIRTNTLVNDPYQHPCERSVPTPWWTIRGVPVTLKYRATETVTVVSWCFGLVATATFSQTSCSDHRIHWHILFCWNLTKQQRGNFILFRDKLNTVNSKLLYMYNQK